MKNKILLSTFILILFTLYIAAEEKSSLRSNIEMKQTVNNEDCEVIYYVSQPENNRFKNLFLNLNILPKTGGVEISDSRAIDALEINFYILDGDKERPVTLTELGRISEKQSRGPRSEKFQAANAGKSIELQIPISLYYDLSISGIYKLKITHKISVGNKTLTIDVPPLIFPL